MTSLSHHHLTLRTPAPFKGIAGNRYPRAAKWGAIVVGGVLTSPVLLPWLCYGAWLTARDMDRAM
jgi:hypothetical protein